jgi:hypothetical protein
VARFLALAFFLLVLGIANPAFAASQTLLSSTAACASQDPSFTDDDPSGFISPCAAPAGTLTIETLYYQNASRVGGTALAAYPLVRLRTGLTHHLELVLDPPSQVAESGLRGTGLYPITRFGYGLDYTLTSTTNTASGLGLEVQPPSSLFNVNERQSKYIFDYTFGYRLTNRVTLSAIATGASSHIAGFALFTPAAAIRGAFDADPRTEISTDLGERFVAHGGHAQSFSDLALNQKLHKNINYTLGLGTTFNGFTSVGKAHYIATGFNFDLK